MATGQSKSMDYIADLPDKVFAKILNLLPIKQVIRCSIVSKRWDAACRYIIRTRQSLVIGKDPRFEDDEMRWLDWNWEWPSERLDRIFPTNKWLVSAMMRSMNQMEDLTRLCVRKRSVRLADIRSLIRKFADQLTMLEIDFAVSLIGAHVFPHLIRLQCHEFDLSSSAALPKLAELRLYGLRLDNIKKLPNMRLPSLRKLLIVSSHIRGEAELLRGLIQANSDNLTSLKMNGIPLRLDHAIVFPNLYELCCQNVDAAVGCTFPSLTHLTVRRMMSADFLTSLPADQILSLDVCDLCGGDNLVIAISRLRSLKILTFMSLDRILVTDAGLTSLAQLQHLTDVTFRNVSGVTTAGVLTLLRGASRNIVRKFTIFAANVDEKQVTREISLMCEEREAEFDAEMTSYFSNYQIHTWILPVKNLLA